MKTIFTLLFLARLLLPGELHALSYDQKMSVDALKKDPSFKIKAQESGGRVTITMALRRSTNAAVYWRGSLELVDLTERQLARIALIGEDMRRAVTKETLERWDWVSFRPAEVFSFAVDSTFLVKSKLWWETGPQYDQRQGFYGTGMKRWCFLQDLVDAATE